MSLKAKLEAVIYAAEEPVTLAQLAAIFAEEVLQGMGEPEPVPEQMVLSGTRPPRATLKSATEDDRPARAMKRRRHASETAASGKYCSK